MEPYTLKSDQDLNSVRSEHFTHDFLSGYHVIKGCTLPEYYKVFADEIENFEVHDDDIWVTSFPKTGSTWTREIVWCVMNGLNSPNQNLLAYRFPHLEFCTVYDIRKYAQKHKDFVPVPIISDSINLVRNAARPRFIKTHLPWHLLPKQIRCFEKHPKIIHVARNSKDSCVHYFHHSKISLGYTGSFEDFWQLFVTDKLMYTPFWDNVLSYWKQRHIDNLLFITYEDLKKDLSSVIKAVANFLNKELDDEQVEKLLKHLSYESISSQRPIQLEPVIDFLKRIKLCQNETGHFLRAGLIGNYRAQMCADVIDIFDKWTQEQTKDTGLKFDISKFINKTKRIPV